MMVNKLISNPVVALEGYPLYDFNPSFLFHNNRMASLLSMTTRVRQMRTETEWAWSHE